MRYLPSIILIGLACLAAEARAQTPPVFGGGVALFDPEVDTFNVGAVLDAQVVVSEDRRYVTITAQPAISRLTDFATFTVSGTQIGFVGGGAVVGGGTGIANRGSSANSKPVKGKPTKATDVPPPAPAGVLGQRGIFQLASLTPSRR